MRIALAQINPTVGDIAANSAKILDFLGRAKAQKAALVVFPELCVCGYPPKDLLLKPGFINDNIAAVKRLAERVSGIDVIVGYAERNAALQRGGGAARGAGGRGAFQDAAADL